MSKTLRLLVSGVLLGWLAWRTDWAQVRSTFAGLRLTWWLAAVGIYAATQVVSALRWQLLARPLGFCHSLARFTGFYFLGMFFNLLLPTSVGGDVVRAWYLAGQEGPAGMGRRRLAAFFSVFIERFSGLLVLLALAGTAVLCCPIALPGWIHACVWIAVGGAAAGLAFVAVGYDALRTRFPVLQSLPILLQPSCLAASTLLSLVVQAANVVLVWLIGLAIDAPVPAAFYWVLVPMVTLLTLLPVSVNGMGVREGGTALFLAPLGVAEGTALSLAFLWFAVLATVSLAGGSLYLFGVMARPTGPAPWTGLEETDHGSVRGDPDQGRVRQSSAAA